jgi:hypothetical protein
MGSLENVADWFLDKIEGILHSRFEKGWETRSVSIVVHPETKYWIMHAAYEEDIRPFEMIEAPPFDEEHAVDTPFARVKIDIDPHKLDRGEMRVKVTPTRVREILDEYVLGPYPSPMDRRFTIREPRLQGPAQYA